jgi:carbonic anhydrase
MSDTSSGAAAAALERLRAGNRRFVDGGRPRGRLSHQSAPRRALQGPGTVRNRPRLLGFASARRDRLRSGVGDLFVIRVAGNIVAPSQVGSVEFAAERFHTRLVVVLGHSQCGAITATSKSCSGQPRCSRGTFARSSIACAVSRRLLDTELRHDYDALVSTLSVANIRASVDHLRQGSEALEQLINDSGLSVVGAEYSLEPASSNSSTKQRARIRR